MEFLDSNQPKFLGATDWETITAALREAVRTGAKGIRIPRYNARTGETQWTIEKAIAVPSGMTVVLDNCKLVQASGCYDHLFTAEKGAENIAVLGEGNVTLSGGEPNRLQETTAGKYGLPEISVNAMLYFDGVKGLTFDNLHIEDQRWAAFDFKHCENIKLTHLDFQNVPHLPNLTAMLFEHGCKHVEIEDITGRSGHDTIYIRANERETPGPDTEICDFKLRTVNVDPARGSIVQFNVSGGNKVHDFTMDTIYDSSDFFEKRRSESTVGVGHPSYRPVKRAELGDIYNIRMKNAISRSNAGISVCDALRDSSFENFFTFGDIITAIASRKKDVKLENVVFDRIYHGQGSSPNNSTSFISLQARGQKAVNLDTATGTFEVNHFYLPDEEDAQ